MAKPRPPYSRIVEQHQETFNKIAELEFWRCEYSKRKYILDIQARSTPACEDFSFPYGIEKLDRASHHVWYHVQTALGMSPHTFFQKQQAYNGLERLLISYHNYIYKYNPKFIIFESDSDKYHFENNLPLFDEQQLESIKILHSDSEKYGFIPSDMVVWYDLDQIEKYISKYITKNGRYPHFQNPFLMKSKNNPDYYYRDKDGKQFFVNDNNKNYLYVYIKCLDENEILIKIVSRTIALINSAIKNKTSNSSGNKESADIQLCIYDKSVLKDKVNLKANIRHNLAAYRNYHSPEKFLHTADTILSGKHVMVPSHEQVPFHMRAMGLWIWDQVVFHDSKISEATIKARDIAAFRQAWNTEMSTIERTYRLAKHCINQMAVLKFSEIR